MPTQNRKPVPAKPDLLARYGLILPESTLRMLRKRGIRCETSLTLEYQQQQRRYVLRGTESGGAVSDMGRYCGFLSATGTPQPWLQPIDTPGVNGRHAIVLAPELARVDIFRVNRTYELSITLHRLESAPGQTRPRIVSRTLFQGVHGTLAIDLWKKANSSFRFSVAPIFYAESGDEKRLPTAFEHAVRVVTGAVSTIGCKRCCIAVPPLASTHSP